MFLPFTPIMSALSASTPILKGQLSDHDLRWEVIEMAVDCRTSTERDSNSEDNIYFKKVLCHFIMIQSVAVRTAF